MIFADIGDSLPVHDGASKVTGALLYTGDLQKPGTLHMKFYLSPRAHCRILSFDLEEAERVPGVRKIYTCFNTRSRQYNSAKRFDGHQIVEDETVYPRVLRFKGDIAAAVVADTPEAAAKAARMIRMEAEDLPAVFTLNEALMPDAPVANDAVLTGNRITDIIVEYGDSEAALERADQVFEDIRETPAIHHLALEPHTVLAEYREKRKLVIHSSTQNTFAVRLLLSELLEMPRSCIQVIKPAMGGAFGAKIPMILEPYAAIAALDLGAPVRIELTRKEVFLCTRTRHASSTKIRTAVSPEGEILAQDIEYLINAGAYCTQSVNVAAAAAHKAVKLYRIPHFRITATPVYTNLPVAGAMRGYGSPQLYFAVQTHLKRIADALGMDFVDFQKKNLILPESTEPVYGSAIGNPRPLDCVETGAELFGWRDNARKSHREGFLRGDGMAVGMHGNGVFKVHVDFTGIHIKLNEDGTLVFFTGSHDMGNGSVTLQKMILSRELKIPVDHMEALETDTDSCPWNLGDFASRGVFVSAEAARKSALLMKELLLREGRLLWESRGWTCEPGSLELGDRCLYHLDSGRQVTLKELLQFIYQVRQFSPEVSGSHANGADRTSYGAHFAEVEICRKTGELKVCDYTAVHDAGTVLNRMGIEGQLEGAIQISTGYALCEEMVFDDTGKLMNGNLKKYRTIDASGMPRNIRMAFIEEGDEPGPYGAKSIGECSVVPGAPAVANAVASALGCYPERLPVTREWIVEKLKEKGLFLG